MFRSKLDAIIVNENGVLTLTNLAEFPFVRFAAVKLDYNAGSHLIANKCEIFASQLQKLPRLNEANSICVLATVNQKVLGYFIDHTQLLEHLRNRLLPICGNCRRFEFRIYLGSDSDKDTVANIITEILEMQQVNECSNVCISLVIPNQYDYRLPVKTISNWLHRNRNVDKDGTGKEIANQKQRERILEIEAVYISNVLEMLNHLKEVLFNCL